MPDFSTLQISNSGTSDVIAADVVGQTISFALTFTRQITVDIPATFQFRTTSDDGSILYIDNQVVVNNDGLHPARTVTGQIFLNPGVYNLRVEFFQRFGGRVLEVLYRASGGNFENIPSNGQLNAGSANVSEMGSWSPVIQWPHIAISAANLPDGRILTWSSTEIDSFPANREFSHSAVFDPLDNSFITTNNNFHDMFCAGVSTLENGTIVASGGNPTDRRTSAFSPDAFSWSSFENMFDNRWYGTNITLPNNEIFSTFANGSGNRSEKYNPASDEWIRTPNASMQTILNEHNSIGNMEWYALLAVEPNGRVFHGGPTLTFHSFDPVNGTANEEFGKPTGDRARKWGNITTYDVGKIVLIGGADFRENPRTITSNVYLVDLNGPSPVISQGADMNYPRATSNTVTLPNGEVMVIGGNTTGLSFSDAQSVMPAEIYNPDTNAWHVVDSIDVPRNYHSTALLMKDGRVLSAGGGGCGSCSVNHLDGQIFSPPYLFNSNGSPATRPSLNNVPSASGAADMFTVTASADTTRFSMVRLSATTHHVNTDQRFVPVQSTSNQDGTFTLTMNANPNVLIPGYYWLYALNDDGTPSIGETIQIRRDLTRDPDDFVDSDDDGIIDTEDDFPNDPNETSDSDGDGVGDNSDAFPNDPNESQDTDGDGVGDNTDAFPNDPNESQDSDGDGFGDNIDSTPFTGSNIVALPQQPRNSTTLIVENSGGQDRIWNVNPDNNSVSVSGQNGILITEIAVGQKPWSLAKSPNSSQILVTNKADASISIIDTLTLSVINTVPLPRASQPHGIVFNSSGTQYFVVLEALARLQKFDASSHTLLGDLALDGSPRHLAMRHDDSRIFVTNFITPPMPGESTAQVALQTGAGEVFVIDPVNMLRDNIVSLGYDGRQPTESRGPGLPNYLNAPVISFDDQIAFVPSKKDNIGSGALRGGVGMTFDQTVRANTSIFDVRTESENSLRIDFDNSSLATGAALTGDNRYLFVALETSRELAVYDVVNGFELMRLPTGRAPQGVALSTDSRIAYVHNFMDRSISRFNLVEMIETSLPASNPLSSVSLVNNESLNSQVFLGKQLFYDAADNRLSRDNYMSCASCHNDGGQDGRVWDFTHLGEGLRNTIAMNGRAATGHGFQHWTANFDELQDFEAQIRVFAGGTGLMSDADFFTGTRSEPLGDPKAGISSDLDALAAYVASLNSFEQSPYRNQDGSLTASGVAGRAVFEAENCADCHGGAAFTNSADELALRNIGTIKPASGSRLGNAMIGIDVPTLRDVWNTGPYLHDGSALTLADAIDLHNGISIGADDMTNVVAFIKQIGNEEATAPKADEVEDNDGTDNPDDGNPDDGNQDTTPPDGEVLELSASDATLTGNFALTANGEFIGVPDGDGDQFSVNTANSAEFTFRVEVAGTYQVQGGILSPNGSSDSFFVQVNDSPIYLWDTGIETSITTVTLSDRNSGIVSVFLEPGSHTVTVYLREDGTQLSQLRLVLIEAAEESNPDDPADDGSNDSGSDNEVLERNADEANLQGSFVLSADSQFIEVPESAGDQYSFNTANRAVFTFQVNQAGTYQFQGDILSPDGASDSFFVQVNDSPIYLWDTDIESSFTPITLSDRNSGTVTQFLNSGSHTVNVYLREDGIQLSKFRLVLIEAAQDDSAIEEVLERTASEATLSGDFVLSNDGLHAEVSESAGDQYSFSTASYAEFTFSVSTVGFYQIEADVLSANGHSDSFFVQVNDSSIYLWDTGTSSTFKSIRVSDRNEGTVEHFFGAGDHMVTFYLREDGIKLGNVRLVIVE